MRKLLFFAFLFGTLGGSVCGQSPNGAYVSPSSVGSVPTVTVNPSSCTTGQTFFNTTTSQFLLCIAANTLSTASGSPATVIDAALFGVKADWKEFFGNNVSITVTNGQAAFTCTGCFTGTEQGKLLVVTNAGSATGPTYTASATGSVFPAGTTIASVTPPNSATASNNATNGCSGSQCWVLFGDDDDVATTGAWTAVMNALANANTCAVVQNPMGITNWNSTGKFNLVSASCAKTGVLISNASILTNAGSGMRGYGPGVSRILLTPTFASSVASSGCPAGNYTYSACMFGVPDVVLQDFSIFGAGQNCPNGTCGATGNLIGLYGAVLINVGLSGFGGAGTSSGLIGMNCIGFCTLQNTVEDGFGALGFSCAGPCTVHGSGPAGSSFLDNLQGNLTGNGLYTDHVGLGNSAAVQAGVALYTCSGVCTSEADFAVYQAVGTYQLFKSTGSGKFTIRDYQNSIAVPANLTGFYDAGGGTGRFYVTGSNLLGGSAANVINMAANSIFTSGGNNNILGTVQSTGAYTMNAAQDRSLQGACTGVVTASSTLGLYGTGPNETLTTCTSTTIGSGKVMDHAGTAFILKVSATAAGVNASSGVVTVLKNGGATTITCTVGTGTSCTDQAHNFAFVAGDLISIQFTTQAADTLAGVKAMVDLEF